MGKVKHVDAILDNDWEVRITYTGATVMMEDGNVDMSVNDLEQMLAVIHYLRQVAPFEHIDTKITAEFSRIEK